MAEVFYAHKIGQHLVRPSGWGTDEQLDRLKRYDTALGNAGHDKLHYAPASFFVWDLHIHKQIASGATVNSLPFTAPWPLTIWQAQLGAETVAGTATANVMVAGSSVLDAAEAITTGAIKTVAPEDGSEDVDAGQTLALQVIAAGGSPTDGAQGKLYCQRR